MFAPVKTFRIEGDEVVAPVGLKGGDDEPGAVDVRGGLSVEELGLLALRC